MKPNKQSRRPSSEKMENTIIKNEARVDIMARQLKDIGKNMISNDREIKELRKRQDNFDETIRNELKYVGESIHIIASEVKELRKLIDKNQSDCKNKLKYINKDVGEAIHIIASEVKDIENNCLKLEDNLHNILENNREKDTKYMNRKLDSIDTTIEKLKIVLKSHIDYTKKR